MSRARYRLTALTVAACLFAGCGSGGSSDKVSSSDTVQSTDQVQSVPNAEQAEFASGYYRISAGTPLDDGAGNALSNPEERIAYGEPDGRGRLKISLPCKTGENELGEAQYVNRDFYLGDHNAAKQITADEVRQAVVDYALEMSRKPKQTYELSGELVTEDEARSDCSGMTELAYLQVGIYLEHYADAQANGGDSMQMIFDNLVPKGVQDGIETYSVRDAAAELDISKLEKGDLLFFLCATNSSSDNALYTDNGIGHVGMYIGDGKMVHFTADYGITNNPCRTEELSDYQQRVLKVQRAVRYIF